LAWLGGKWASRKTGERLAHRQTLTARAALSREDFFLTKPVSNALYPSAHQRSPAKFAILAAAGRPRNRTPFWVVVSFDFKGLVAAAAR